MVYYSKDGTFVGALIVFNDASVMCRQLHTQSPGCVCVKDANLRCEDMASLNTRPTPLLQECHIFSCSQLGY